MDPIKLQLFDDLLVYVTLLMLALVLICLPSWGLPKASREIKSFAEYCKQ
jgi:hypothetical protein